MSQLRTAVVMLVTLLLGLALAGCGAEPAGDSDAAQAEAPGIGLGGDDGHADESEGEAASGDSAGDSGGGGEPGGAAGADADADAAEAAAEGAVGASSAGSAAVQRGRKVVTTTIDVAVEDVGQSAQRVRDIALVAGGYVAAEETAGGEQPRAVLTLRVPVTGAADVMSDVADLGEEVNRTSDEEEVENRLVDLESRVATQRAGVERVRALLQDAQSLDDVLALERELTRRQADLESLDAQRAALEDRAALATVTVRLTLPEDAEPAEAEVPPFLRGLQGGWEALAASTGVVLVIMGSLLPFAVVALALGAVVLLAVRALRRATGGRPGAGPLSAAPGQGTPGGGVPAAARPATVAPPAHNEV